MSFLSVFAGIARDSERATEIRSRWPFFSNLRGKATFTLVRKDKMDGFPVKPMWPCINRDGHMRAYVAQTDATSNRASSHLWFWSFQPRKQTLMAKVMPTWKKRSKLNPSYAGPISPEYVAAECATTGGFDDPLGAATRQIVVVKITV
jgi:hypothetical protein